MAQELSFPTDSDRPPFLSKTDNFKREKSKKRLDKIWNTISSYHKNPKLLSDTTELLKGWSDMDKKSLIYERIYSEPPKEIYVVQKIEDNKDDENEEMVIKVYYLPPRMSDESDTYKGKVSVRFKHYYLMHLTGLQYFHGIFYDAKERSVYVSMEKLQKTLKEYVEEKYSENGDGIDEQECKQIIGGLLDNLWTLHLTGNVHADIKPTNIMLRDKTEKPEYNGWKLIDYDGRRYLGNKTYKYSTYGGGTIEWTPPEVDQAPHIMSVESYICYGYDTWSIGLIILYILFGTQPYILTEEEDNYWMPDRYWYYTKLLKNGKYDMDSDKNEGEIWIKNYIIGLYAENKISGDLFDMLFSNVFHFDPRKRANPKELWNHKWMESYRQQQR